MTVIYLHDPSSADSRDKSNVLKKEKKNLQSTNTGNAQNFATRHDYIEFNKVLLCLWRTWHPNRDRCRCSATLRRGRKTRVDTNAFCGGLPCAAAAALQLIIVPTSGNYSMSRVSKTSFKQRGFEKAISKQAVNSSWIGVGSKRRNAV